MDENSGRPPMKLVHAFHIDDNELEGLTLQEAFTLGVEWAMFWSHLKKGFEEFEWSAHSANADRLMKLAREYAYLYVTSKRLDDTRTIIVVKRRQLEMLKQDHNS